MYSTREGACPAGTLPKLKLEAESVTCGPAALPRRLRGSRLPPAVETVKSSDEKVPVCLGEYTTRITVYSSGPRVPLGRRSRAERQGRKIRNSNSLCVHVM